jgi:hypothetical protein
MTQSAKAQETSMDEILASIRRMIAYDDPARSAPLTGGPAISDTGASGASAPSQPSGRAEASSDVKPTAPAATGSLRNEAARAWPRTQTAEPRPAQTEQPQLSSPATAAAVDAALDALVQAAAANSPRTLEDVARDLMRPMLKTWLDDNLPQLVERLVRAEVERLSRGR